MLFGCRLVIWQVQSIMVFYAGIEQGKDLRVAVYKVCYIHVGIVLMTV